MLRMSRNNQGIGVSSLKFFHRVQLQDTGQSWHSALPTIHKQYNMHGLPHSRLLLDQQQAVAHQLQLECCQRVTLDLLTSMLPFFPTRISHMNTVLMYQKVAFTNVS